MQIFFPKEEGPETRATILPEVAKKFIDLGIDVVVETQIGSKIFNSDEMYSLVGAKISSDRLVSNAEADIVCRINKPNKEEIASLKKGSIHISFLDPFNESELVNEFASSQITAISMELVPRITRAQKMDALSSQANLGGYSAVIEASKTLLKSFPMMMTAAGTISPSRVFVIGVGVAGLQAIATAKRLGARVDAFDTRPIVEEQVQSLGAKFAKIDIGVTEETDQGYAKELTPDQIALQQEGMKKICGQSDVVITTAQVFGRPAPRIVSREMVEAMKPGSVIVDMAVATGGNVEGSIVDEHVVHNGVTIIGMSNLPGSAAINASQMYGNNLFNMIEEYWDSENKTFNFDLTDEILKGCVVTHQGEIVNEMVKDRR
jgi:NAD(P) transhydrogenase subunit alpha|tara:strand:+ start:1066 stop:2193 length:1128 start_codon:yes stop_codon:yes gene_type:complete